MVRGRGKSSRRRGTRSAAAAAALLLVMAASGSCECGAPSGIVDVCSGDDSGPPFLSTDILLVIDNSASMLEEQEKVANELSTFVQSLVRGPVDNDFQVGVITTGVSLNYRTCDPRSATTLQRYPEQSGRLQFGKLADGSRDPASIRRILGGDDVDLVEQLERLVQQGTNGSGEEMGLEAIRLALSAPLIDEDASADPPGNAGFLRPGARLLVVVVSDEDDCSDPTGEAVALEPICGGDCTSDAECGGPGNYCIVDGTGARKCSTNHCETTPGRNALEPVRDYVDFLQNLDDGTGSGRTREAYLAVIGAVSAAGDPERCASGTDEAQGVGERYAEAVSLMGNKGYIGSICDDSYHESLSIIAGLISAAQVLDLPVDPGSGHLIQVELTRANGEVVRCLQGEGFTYEASSGEAPARLRMEGRCELLSTDQIRLEYVCAS
ncbi:MAG: hypothetical protein P1V51_02395 [Deltaproteobacteria bacterium]|nr:hypothetical protein [Deltaproteobacteria bacterium]